MITHMSTKTVVKFSLTNEKIEYGIIELDRTRTVKERWEVTHAEVTYIKGLPMDDWFVDLWGFRLRTDGTRVKNAKLAQLPISDLERKMLPGRASQWIPSQAASLKALLRQEAAGL
jgi:hypothetical protein